MKSWAKIKLANWVLRHLLNAVIVEDIITTVNGKVSVGGKEISPDRLKLWQAEVKAIEGADIWKCSNESIKFQAQDKIFNRAEKFEDNMYGKSMLYNLSIFSSIFKVVKSRQVK